MPPKFSIQAPKCARCEKSAYQAEQVVGPAGKIYHKMCLKCMQCEKRLDSLSLQDHDGDPYCKMCHKKYFGPKGYGNNGTHTETQMPSEPLKSPPKRV